jgi:hypothetical protein
MNIANQLQKVRFFLAENGFVAVLKELPVPPVPAVEGDGMAGEKPAHHGCHGWSAGAQKKADMVGHQRSSIARGGCVGQNSFQAIQETFPVRAVLEDIPALYTADDDVVQCAGGSMRACRGMWLL